MMIKEDVLMMIKIIYSIKFRDVKIISVMMKIVNQHIIFLKKYFNTRL